MIANVPIPTISSSIDYTLIPTKGGWRLSAWESATVTKDRRRPLLYLMRLKTAVEELIGTIKILRIRISLYLLLNTPKT
jgi:hypothetical protein